MRLKVDQKHIDAARDAYAAEFDYMRNCPIALALLEAGLPCSVHVNEYEGWAFRPLLGGRLRLSDRARRMARRFDNTRQFKPGTYVLTPITEEANK